MSYARFRDLLAEANPPEYYPIHWLDRQVEMGLLHPIVGERSAMVLGLRMYPGGARVGHIKAAVGDMDELIHSLGPVGEQWSRERGCTEAMIEGRVGWARVLKQHGWNAHQCVLKKDL